MVVSKEIARLEHSSVKLTVTVGKNDVKAQYDDLMKSYGKSIQIKGFRKGMVPRDVLERKFGESLKGEALGHIMEKSLEEIFKEEAFDAANRPLPYSTPSVKDEPKLDFGSDLTFTVEYDVFPEVKVGTWKGIEVEVPVAEVAEEDLSRELEQLRDRNAVVIDKDEKGKVAKNDVVTVNYSELAEDGSVLPGTERQDYVFTVGTGQNVFKFDDEIVGMKKDETKNFDKTYGADFPDPEFAGKTKKLRVTVTALKEKKLPALDDDLAQDISEKYKTLADLKADIKGNLGKTLENKIREKKVNAFLEKVLETTTIDLPQSMIRIELESRWRTLARRFNANADQLMAILASGGKDYEGLMAEWKPDVEKALKSRLIVENLMKELDVKVDDADLEKEFETMAASMNAGIDEVKKHYERDDMKDYLRDDIKERRLFDLVFAETKTKKGKKVKYLDLVAQNG
ncbi:MAG: trigger factor [Treponemataceae bacterium]